MTPEKLLSLPRVPRTVANAIGHPQFGTYQGELPTVELNALVEPYHLNRARRLLHHKKWQYALVATPQVLAVFAVVDLSYSANAFVAAVDLTDGKVLHDASFLGVPGPLVQVSDSPGEGLDSRFRTLRSRFACRRGVGKERYTIDVQLRGRPGLRWKGDVLAVGGPPALTVIAPVANGGVVNVTQKWAGLLSFGTLEAGGRTYALDGGVAGLDYTHGYLARHTSWRWAMGVGRTVDGTPIGLNLVEGFNEDAPEANENALWIGNRLVPLARARFSFHKQDLLDPWHVRTVDGAVDLHFKPIHVHREDRDYRLIRSRFAQPLGRFEGKIKLDGQELAVSLAGVTEDQEMLW